jgi:hypothetical protein
MNGNTSAAEQQALVPSSNNGGIGE